MPEQSSILTLTQGVADGDHACFDALHARWHHPVAAWVARTLPRWLAAAHASDVEQEVWLRVIRGIRPIECELRFERWLRSVALNAARDRIRAETRRLRRERATSTTTPSSIHPRDAPHADRAAEAIAALRAIDTEVATLIDLRFRTEATLDRLASLAGLTPGAVDGRIRRGLSAIRRSLTTEATAPATTTPRPDPEGKQP